MELSTRLGNGQTMNEIVELYSKASGFHSFGSAPVYKKGTDSYPEGFFEKVQQLSVGSNTVLIMDNYIFLILRENPRRTRRSNTTTATATTASKKSLRGDEFKTIVEGYASELSVERNDRVINKAVKEVLKDG